MPAICTAWGVLIALALAWTAAIVGIGCRQHRLAARLIVFAIFVCALGLVLPGYVVIATNDWLGAAALSWTDAPRVTTPMRYDRR
jgi:hypothetical protein